MNLYAIGDIHGNLSALTALFDAVAPKPEDGLVFLGDYVDKGPDVQGVLEFLIEQSKNDKWVFLRGNHDQMFLNAWLDKTNFAMWECLAGEKPLKSYGNGGSTQQVFDDLVPDAHFEFLRDRCVYYHETKEYIFVHAGIQAHVAPEDEDPDRLQWSSIGLASPHVSKRTVICGHSAQESGEIVDLGHSICIDTGITKGQKLTCLNLTDFSYTQSDCDGNISTDQLRLT